MSEESAPRVANRMAVAERYAKFARWRERSVIQVEAFTWSEMLEFKSSAFTIEELIELESSFWRW